MYTIAIGGIRPRSVLHRPFFWAYAVPSFRQAQTAPGVLQAQVGSKWGLQFSFTVWADPKAMRAFSLSGAHRRAMRAASWISGVSYFKVYQADSIPSFAQALDQWRLDPKGAAELAKLGFTHSNPAPSAISGTQQDKDQSP